MKKVIGIGIVCLLGISLLAPTLMCAFAKTVVIYEDVNSMSYLQGETPSVVVELLTTMHASADTFTALTSMKAIKQRAGAYYGVVVTEEGHIALIFDAEMKCLMNLPIDFSHVTEDQMNQLQPGMTYADVVELDPDGDYAYFGRGTVGGPYYSTHYLESGLVYCIEYDDAYIIVDITMDII